MDRLALLTCTGQDDLAGEREPLLLALEAAGFATEILPWDAPDVAWDAFDAAVIRSTWDYFDRRDEFCAWAHQVEGVVPLANSAALVAWNSDKAYMADLADAGVPIVRTHFLAPDDRDLPHWADFVVKPTISGGARLTGWYSADTRADALALVDEIHATGSTVMAQPFIPAVNDDGETDVLVFGGRISHAVDKGGVIARPGRAAPSGTARDTEWHRPHPMDDRLVEFTHQVLDAVQAVTGEDPVYARVDSVVDNEGRRLLMEVELIEPYLFLSSAPDADEAAAAYALALRHWLDLSR